MDFGGQRRNRQTALVIACARPSQLRPTRPAPAQSRSAAVPAT